MKTLIKFMFLLIASILLSSCTNPRKTIDEPVESDSIELSEYTYVPTVQDVLEQRNELKYALWCDSIYLTIPDQILIQMLVTKGTTISITEIVEDYWQNKQWYHDTILKTMNIQKQYIPDSLPNKPN